MTSVRTMLNFKAPALVAALLLGLAVLPAEAAPLRMKGSSAPAEPGGLATLAPSASYNGTPCSGFAGGCPADNVRSASVAQPAIHWLSPGILRFPEDTQICVDADAKGGVQKVIFKGEGGEAEDTTAELIVQTDVNGQSRTRYGYCVQLDSAVWKSRSGSADGTSGRIFAEAIPNDPTMASRTIGGTATIYNGDYPMVVYPRTALYSWPGDADGIKTVCPSGCDYTSLRAAIDAAITAGAKAPGIRIDTTGSYELTDRTGGAGTSEGWLTIFANTGVTATLGRAAAFSGSASDSTAWDWYVGWNNVQFRGEGIVFDQLNWSTVNSSNPVWFNGIVVTNSVGLRDTYYWNGDNHPGWGGPEGSYYQDMLVEYGNGGGAMTARFAMNVDWYQATGDLWSRTHYIYGTYTRDYSSQWIRELTSSLVISYSGGATATVTKSGNNTAARTLSLIENGVTVTTIPMGFYSSDTNPTAGHVRDAINAYGNGWSASITGTHALQRAVAISPVGAAGGVCGNAFTGTSITAGGISFPICKDVHGDWYQSFTGGPTRQNVIIRNNVLRDAVNLNAYINDDATLSYDRITKNNIWLNVVGDNTTFPSQSGFGGTNKHHIVFNNNLMHSWIFRVQSSAGDRTYSEAKNNIVGKHSGSGSTTCDQDAPWTNGATYAGGFGACVLNTGGNTGMFTYAGNDSTWFTGMTDLMVDPANGDLAMDPGGTIDTNRKPSTETYDAFGCAFSATDWIGAVSKNCAVPAFPF